MTQNISEEFEEEIQNIESLEVSKDFMHFFDLLKIQMNEVANERGFRIKSVTSKGIMNYELSTKLLRQKVLFTEFHNRPTGHTYADLNIVFSQHHLTVDYLSEKMKPIKQLTIDSKIPSVSLLYF